MSSNEDDKTRSIPGVKFSGFTKVEPDPENKIEVVGLRDGDNVRADLTTDLVSVNPNVFRDGQGRFAVAPEELGGLTNQRGVNELLWRHAQETSDEADQLKLRVQLGEATQQQVVSQINESLQVQADILLKVGELEISKGSVARYKVMGTEFQVASRAGELYVSSPDASQVVNISLAILDLDDSPTKPCHEDDIIEFDWPDGGVARYQVVSGDSQALVVSYLSGTHTFEADQELETYVYPQNKGSASIDYVDAQDDLKLDKTGGTVTGDIAMSGKRITGLGDPTSNAHAATKKYVDQRNTNGISTQLWKYCEGKDRSELKAREFTVNFVNGDKDQIEIYIYPYLNGRWWAPAINTNYTHQIGETYCTISDWQGACAIGFKGLKWWFIQQAYDSNGTKRWHNALQGNYYKLAYPETYRLKDQHWYNLNLPSPFPLVNFPEEVHTGGMGATFGIDPEEAPVPPDAIDMGEVLP